jgi:hypothetical protein
LNKTNTIAILLCAAAAVAGFAQKLPGSSPAATVDGVIAANEYALVVPLDTATLYATRTADTLFLALEAQTTGWVALGAGSAKMDQAWIYIGYVTGDQAVLAPQQGAGHGHKDASGAPQVKYKLGEREGRTTLELAFRSADLIASGQTELACLVAYGSADNLSSYHAFRRAVTIQL